MSFSTHAVRRLIAHKTSATTAAATTPQHPLHGVRILDLTRIIAGPFCTQILSDLGADVLKIEQPGVGDESRHWGPPFLPNSTDSVYFTAANRNKRSVCVNLKHTDGQKLVADLAAASDVFVENYLPGKLASFGLDYEQLRAVAPRLVYCSITGYGRTGPYAHRPGYDVIAASQGGLLHITGGPDAPSKAGVAMTDLATGLYAHGAIMAALLQRERTGRGQRIDCNLLSTQVASLINVGANWLNGGREARRWGTAHESIVPYQTFRTADGGWLTVGTGSDRQYRELCDRLGRPELATDVRFKTNRDRVTNREILVDIVSDCLAAETTERWLERFEGVGFPVGPVNSVQQVFEDRHVREVGLVKELEHSQAGTVKVVGPPVKYSEAANTARTAPPRLGEHTEEVLSEVLGLCAAEIAELTRKGVVQ